MPWFTCSGCKIMTVDREGSECSTCRSQPKCPDCGKPFSVSNSIQYCQTCVPLWSAVTAEDGTSKNLLYSGPDAVRAAEEFNYEVDRHGKTGLKKRVFTLWEQTYYGSKTPGERVWQKRREVTVQPEFRDRTRYAESLDAYREER